MCPLLESKGLVFGRKAETRNLQRHGIERLIERKKERIRFTSDVLCRDCDKRSVLLNTWCGKYLDRALGCEKAGVVTEKRSTRILSLVKW